MEYAEKKKVTLSFPLLDSAVLLFLLSKVAQKKKKQKENAVKETRKRELFGKSSLLNSRKNFSATHAGMSGECDQSTVPACSPHRKVPRKNFLTTHAGMLGVCTQSNAPACSPHRKVVGSRRRQVGDSIYYSAKTIGGSISAFWQSVRQ